jgi:hypothetical protein
MKKGKGNGCTTGTKMKQIDTKDEFIGNPSTSKVPYTH